MANSGSEVFTIFILILAAAALVFFIEFKSLNAIYKNRVIENSTRYKALLKINKECKFFEVEPVIWVKAITESKRQFDNFDCEGYLQHEMAKNLEFFENYIKKIEYNKAEYFKYCNKVNDIQKDKCVEDAKKCKIKYVKFLEIEEFLLIKNQKKPTEDAKIVLQWGYISPKGRNRYVNSKTYDLSQIKDIFEKTKNGIETKSVVAYERALMTNDLRYDVLRRDGFRCQICGRTQADGVKLHVDHIKPVSKGGRTTMSNLRTLCEQCNLGKSNKYNPKGVN